MHSHNSALAPSKKFDGLEICRFICALAVVIWHYQHFFVLGLWDDTITKADRRSFPLYDIFFAFYQYGGQAVEIFWAISGFIFFWKYRQAINDGSVKAGRFFILRLSRLYPLHFATLFVVVIGQFVYVKTHGQDFIYSANSATNFATQLLLASNWFPQQPFTFNGPIWSISAEVLVYAVFFVVARNVLIGSRLTFFILVGLTGILTIYYAAAIHCLQLFFAGGLIEILLVQMKRQARRIIFYSSAAILTLGAVVTARYHMPEIYKGLLIASSVVVCAVLFDEVMQINLRRFVWLGNLTYSSYLLHFPIQLTIVCLCDTAVKSRAIFRSPVVFVLYLVIVMIAAYLAYRYFEIPMQDKIRNARGRLVRA